MISTLEVFLLLGLLILLIVGVLILLFFRKQNKVLGEFKFARGANGKDGQDIHLSCGTGKAICIYRATQICSTVGPNGFERSNLDPISNGIVEPGKPEVSYGDFNPETTVDLTKKMGDECNGKPSYTYKFQKDWSSKPVECNGKTQLIATYVCISEEDSKAGKCNSWSPKNEGLRNLNYSVPDGCTRCEDTGLIECPIGILPESNPLKNGNRIPKGTAGVISSYRMSEYDSEEPSYSNLDGKGVNYWWRQSGGCPK